MLRNICWATALVLATAPAAPAQDKLAWKLKAGDTFYSENVSKMKQTIKVGGMEMKQDGTMTFVSRYEVKKAGATVVLEQKLESAKENGTSDIGDKLIKRLKGAVFTITLDVGGSLTGFAGYDDLVASIAKESKKDAQMFKTVLPEDSLNEEAAQTFGFLPGKAVAKGDTWKRPWTMSMSVLGSFKAENVYTYKGPGTGGDRIDVTTTGSYSAPMGDGAGAPFKVTKGNLEAKAAKGTIIFDPVKGRLVSYKSVMLIKGKLTLEAMGNAVDAGLDIDGAGTIRITDKAPSDD